MTAASADNTRTISLTAAQLTEITLRHAGHDPRHRITLTAVGDNVAVTPVMTIDPAGMPAAQTDLTCTVEQFRSAAAWARDTSARIITMRNDHDDIIVSDPVADVARITADGAVTDPRTA